MAVLIPAIAATTFASFWSRDKKSLLMLSRMSIVRWISEERGVVVAPKEAAIIFDQFLSHQSILNIVLWTHWVDCPFHASWKHRCWKGEWTRRKRLASPLTSLAMYSTLAERLSTFLLFCRIFRKISSNCFIKI